MTPHTRSIYSVSWSKAGNYIATGGGDNKIYVYEINWDSLFSKEGEFEYDIIAESSPENGHQNDVNQVSFAPNSNILASCSDDLSVKIWKFDNNN